MKDAIRLKTQILRTLEAVDKQPELVDDGALNFCIVGGGPTGVELAGAIAELIRSEFTEDYPNLPIDRARVLLYEHSPHLLKPFLPKLQTYAETAPASAVWKFIPARGFGKSRQPRSSYRRANKSSRERWFGLPA